MNLRFQAVLIVLLTIAVGPAFGQIRLKQFTHNQQTFLTEINGVLTQQSSRAKEGKKFMEYFTEVWISDKFTNEQREAIYSVCDLMLTRKMRPYPDFKNYLYAVTRFALTTQPAESFKAWQASVRLVIRENNKREFGDFLAFSDYLFSENAIFKSASTTWKTDNTNYTFELQDGKPVVIFPSLTLTCLAKRQSGRINNTS
ncbi:MAG: hypothetical protein AAGB22_13255, partial [Bacteroidota bacterium]